MAFEQRPQSLLDLPYPERNTLLAQMPLTEKREFRWHWEVWARPEQFAPEEDWRCWLICAGRGFGKTRAGAEWIRGIVKRHRDARIALVAASLAEARAIMVEGESGVMACCPPDREPVYEPSLRRLTWKNGAMAYLYSAAEPESLRGPQHSHAWCDEIAKWENANRRAERAWDNLAMGMRLGKRPQTLATTTPRAVSLMRKLIEKSECGDAVLTSGTTYDNAAYLPDRLIEQMNRHYAGSSLGRQELEGKLLLEWADGNLLRGEAGDLKTGGQLRIYNGFGDQQVDPLILSAVGASCPAFRNCAYAVFEDLQLADFGNRIPALTFEIIADSEEPSLPAILGGLEIPIESTISFDKLSGISYEGGPVANTLSVLNTIYPASINSDRGTLEFDSAESSQTPITVPDASGRSSDIDDFGTEDGRRFERTDRIERLPSAIRYYDTKRDYQPGIQRTEGRASSNNEVLLEFPGSLAPADAKALIGQTKKRIQWETETTQWRTTELNAEIRPGTLVKLPEMAGLWIVEDWEWRDKGIELGLRRFNPLNQSTIGADGGSALSPPDHAISATILRAFELPWDGATAMNSRQVYSAVGSPGDGWKGASLYSAEPNGLTPLGVSTRKYSGIGVLTKVLGPSAANHFEPRAVCELEFATKHAGLVNTDLDGIAAGQNKLLIGEEIIQFASAEQVSETNWKLTGLIRGRAGTEAQAASGHATGSGFIVLDSNLIFLSSALLHTNPDAVVSAIGLGDEQPVSSAILGTGNSNLPLNPVHARADYSSDGSVHTCWVRRSRGAWSWISGATTPLNEESELYRIAIGDPDNPAQAWEVDQPEFSLSAAQADLHSGQSIWVRQIGSHGPSQPTYITDLP